MGRISLRLTLIASLALLSCLSITPSSAWKEVTCDGPMGQYTMRVPDSPSDVCDWKALHKGWSQSQKNNYIKYHEDTQKAGMPVLFNDLGWWNEWACKNGFTVQLECGGSAKLVSETKRITISYDSLSRKYGEDPPPVPTSIPPENNRVLDLTGSNGSQIITYAEKLINLEGLKGVFKSETIVNNDWAPKVKKWERRTADGYLRAGGSEITLKYSHQYNETPGTPEEESLEYTKKNYRTPFTSSVGEAESLFMSFTGWLIEGGKKEYGILKGLKPETEKKPETPPKEIEKEEEEPKEGDLVVTLNPKVVPVPGSGAASATVTVKARDKTTKKPLKDHGVRIAIENPGTLPFIKIARPTARLNATGSYKTTLSILPPANLDPKTAPLKITLAVTISRKKGTGSLAKVRKTFPLDMTLIHGWTAGPDMKLRPEPEAPACWPMKRYHITSKANPDGEFWVLARPQPQAKQEVDQPWLSWSQACHLSLKFPLPKLLKAGEVMNVGKVDVLSSQEHVDRMKGFAREFIGQMNLPQQDRTSLLNALAKLPFEYNSTNNTPTYVASGTNWLGSVYIPKPIGEYWADNPYNVVDKKFALKDREDPAYPIIFHELGHFIHAQVVETWAQASPIYKFLKRATHSTWTVPDTELESSQQIMSFNENCADFCAYLMFKFLDTAHPEFKESIYCNRSYLVDFDTDREALENANQGGCRVEGVQTTFLRSLYGDNVSTRPAITYADYLRAMLSQKEDNWIFKWIPARTIQEWVAMKKKYGGMATPGNISELVGRYRIDYCYAELFIMAASDQADASVKINGKDVTKDVRTISLYPVAIGDTITAGKGKFVITIVDKERSELIYIRLSDGDSIRLLSLSEVQILAGAAKVNGNMTVKPK